MPNADDPRFLLPRDRRAAVGVLRHFRSGGTRAARYRIAALRATIRVTGGWPLSRNRVAVFTPGPGTPDTIEAHLREILGREISLGIQLGPPRANRKPILQVLDSDGRPLAFGKLGINDLTRRLVRTEAAALRQIAELDLPGIRVPRLVHEGEYHGSALLITTPLPLRAADEEVDADVRTAAMLTLSRAAGTTRSRPGDSPWLADLRERAAALTQESDPCTSACCSRAPCDGCGRTGSSAAGTATGWRGTWPGWKATFCSGTGSDSPDRCRWAGTRCTSRCDRPS